jgi:hypothetical protein
MKLTWILRLTAASVLLTAVIAGCKKDTSVKTPPEIAHFTNETGGTYFITGQGVTWKIPVGFTTVSNVDRTISVSVTSPTGAQQGTDYTLNSNKITIPAGKAVDSITVTGSYTNYQAGKKDTLIFRIQDAKGANTEEYNSVYTLFMRGPCFDGDVENINAMAGTYANAVDADDPKYTVTVSNFTVTGAKTATATINNLWDWFGPVTATFDWTDATNTKVVIARQLTGVNYAAGQPVSIRTSPNQSNKFSVCNNRISLVVDIIIENYFGPGQAALWKGNYAMIINR